MNYITTAWRWIIKPSEDTAHQWRFRIWAAIGIIFLAVFLASAADFFYLFLAVAVLYFIYTLIRYWRAKFKEFHMPSRDELRDRYMEDPDREL